MGNGLKRSQDESLRLIPSGTWWVGGFPGAVLDPAFGGRRGSEKQLCPSPMSRVPRVHVWGLPVMHRVLARSPFGREQVGVPRRLVQCPQGQRREAAAWTSEAKATEATEAAAGGGGYEM